MRGRPGGRERRTDGCAHDFFFSACNVRACTCAACGASGRLRAAMRRRSLKTAPRFCPSHKRPFRSCISCGAAAVPERHSWRDGHPVTRLTPLHARTHEHAHGPRELVARSGTAVRPCAHGDPDFGGRRCLYDSLRRSCVPGLVLLAALVHRVQAHPRSA